MKRLGKSITAPSWKALGRLMGEFRAYRAKIVVVIVLGLVISAVQPVSVKLSQRIIDELRKGMDPSFLRQLPLMVVVLFGLGGLAKYFHNTMRRYVAEKLVIQLRASLFRKYLFLPLTVVDGKRVGEMLSGLQNDLAQISSGLDTMSDCMREPFTFIGLIGVAFYSDWRLTLCTLVAAPVIAYLFSASGKAVKRYSARNLEQFTDLVSLSQESLVGARVVKVFRLENALLDKFHAIQERYFQTLWKSIRVQELATPAVEFIGATLMAAVVVYGGIRASQGLMSAGSLVAFVLALGLAQMPIKKLNNAWLKLKVAEAAAERVYGMLDFSDTFLDLRRSHRRVDRFERSIVFDKVSLWYGDKRALQEISFEVRRGDCVALVGLSGSGKTSIVNLLPRLYDVSDGRILFDGVDLRDFLVDDIRGLFSFVTQDTFLFNDSIYENIRYGNPLATAAQIQEASRLAHCEDFIYKCPQGYETRIGDRGVCLSGGERQRIAIARAFLKGSPILVLDEATSNLDSHSEGIVQQALDTLRAGKTTFLVAHRFSTVRRANRIMVLEDGRIVESGSHDQLITGNGRYSGLYEKQVLVSPTLGG